MSNKPSEILSSEIRQGIIRPGSKEYAVWDTTGGLTDELREANIYKQLGNTYRMRNAEVPEEPAIPTMDVVFTKLGIKDTKDKKAYEHFMEDFPKKANDYKSKLLKDPNWGERGWLTVRDLWRQAVPQYEQEKAQKAREKEVGIIEKVMFPRSTERYISGQEIQDKDVALDVGENAIMAIPGTGWVGAAGRIPRVGGAIARGASRFPNAFRVLGNAAAPVISEFADDVAYDPGEGMDDRADFSVADAILGTAINNAADYAVMRQLTDPLRRFGGVANSGGRGAAREAVAEIGSTSKKRLKDAADANRAKINETASAVISGGSPTAQGLKSMSRGGTDETITAARGAITQAKDYKKVLDLIDKGKINPESREGINAAMDMADRQALFMSNVRQGRLRKQLRETTEPKVEAMLKQQLAEEKALRNNLAPMLNPSNVIKATGLSNEEKRLVNKVFRENPDMYYNLFNDAAKKSDFTKGKLNSLSDWWQGVKDVSTGTIAPWGQNKLGKNEWVGSSVGQLAPVAEEEHKASREKGRKVAFSDVLSASPAGSEDEAFIKAVRDNPDVLTYGLNSGDPATDERFKIWLLKGGHKKISGLPGVRPLWEVR